MRPDRSSSLAPVPHCLESLMQAGRFSHSGSSRLREYFMARRSIVFNHKNADRKDN